jgi:hypothetical protein
MAALISLLSILMLSLIVTRVATIALTHTGLSREAARFQSRSAFTGVGFTTSESEKVVNHPVRRRILMVLMLLGQAGVVTAISSLVLTFVARDETTGSTLLKLGLLALGLVALFYASRSRWVDRRLSAIIHRAIRRYSDLDVRDYESLLQLSGDYRVSELFIEQDDWLAHKALAECKLRDEGVNVLGIQRRDGSFDGSPRGVTHIEPDDCLIVYGRVSALNDLDERRAGWAGERAHREAVARQAAEREHPKAGQDEPEEGPG